MRLCAALLFLILGPFAPWLAYPRSWLRGKGFVFCGVLFTTYALLFLSPVRWEGIASSYLILSALSYGLFMHRQEFPSFLQPSAEPSGKNPALWIQGLSLAVLVVYPCLFGYALSRNVYNLQVFSIHLPASVYTEALSFAARVGTPFVLLLAILIRRTGLRPGIRLVLYLYGGALIMFFWLLLGGRCYDLALHWTGADIGEPLLFEGYRELSFHSMVHGVFYAGGMFLGVGYLALASDGRVFLRRAFLLVFPVALGYAHFSLLSGESNYFLSSLRGSLYRHGHYQAYRAAAAVEVARLPNALHIPVLMFDLAELSSLQGRGEEAAYWRQRALKATVDKPYYVVFLRQMQWEDAQIAAHPACRIADSTLLLRVPRVRSGVTLDENWYGLLSAVAFFHPEWSDFDLKKKLLQISPDIQLSAPTLDNVPVVSEVLDIFGIPFSPCFPDSLRLHEALRQGKIPFIQFEGQWVPLVGWDACRRGYLCYHYPDSLKSNPWLNPADKETVFGKRSDSIRGWAGEIPYNLITFLPERDVLTHLHELGGVAIILGDSNFAPSAERRAAYLTEYGDGLYQELDDNHGAVEAYARAQSLYPSDYILARLVYLERRAVWSEGPDYGLDALFRSDVRKQPLPTGLKDSDRERMKGRILQGEMGQYLLLNWHEASPHFFAGRDSVERDSTRTLFRTWLRLNPDNPAALDSLAQNFQDQERWDSAEVYYRRLLTYYPLGDEEAAYHLAWVLFKQESFQELDFWLQRSSSFKEDARYLLLQGASDWQAGKHREGISLLQKSLKLDKTLPETHVWMERVAVSEGDSTGAVLSRRWQERTDP